MENTTPEPSARFEIDFKAGGAGQEALILGWAQQEPDFIWTTDSESTLCFTAPTGPHLQGDYGLRLAGFPHIRDAVPLQRFEVVVNGHQLGALIVRARFDLEILVPASALGQESRVSITLRFPDAHLPSEFDPASGDHRKLAIAFTRIAFQPLPLRISPRVHSDSSDKEIMMDLQSLGVNCELGFAQRAVAAEPHGLFRWNSITLPDLIRALEHRFEGLGAPENTEAYVDAASEILIVDKKYNFRNHSHAFENKGARVEAIYKRELIRIPQLARMLVENLEDASRLFVFHDAGTSSVTEVRHLLVALRKYGDNTLLWLTKATAQNPAGSAESLEDNFLVGYIDYFQPLRDVTPEGVGLSTWLSVARKAHEIWREQRRIA